MSKDSSDQPWKHGGEEFFALGNTPRGSLKHFTETVDLEDHFNPFFGIAVRSLYARFMREDHGQAVPSEILETQGLDTLIRTLANQVPMPEMVELMKSYEESLVQTAETEPHMTDSDRLQAYTSLFDIAYGTINGEGTLQGSEFDLAQQLGMPSAPPEPGTPNPS